MKLEEGENRFRILSAPIIGWEDWNDKKPVRFRFNAKPDKPIDPLKPIKHFWAFIVFNYVDAKIQILEITQASIRKRLEFLSKDSDWGSPFGYDIKVVKTGQQKDTEYSVNPCPQKPIDSGIKELFAATPIDLEELFRGGDPFVAQGAYRTKAFWEKDESAEVKSTDPLITKDQAKEIDDEIARYINPFSSGWKNAALSAFKISSFDQLKAKHYDLMISRIEQKKDEIKLSDDVPF